MIQETALDNARLALQKRSRLIVVLTTLAAISAAVEIEAQYFGPRASVYTFKPLTMTLIIVIAGMAGVRGQKGYRNLIVAGLCWSLAGDVFLMLPSDQLPLRTLLFRGEDNSHLRLTLF